MPQNWLPNFQSFITNFFQIVHYDHILCHPQHVLDPVYLVMPGGALCSFLHFLPLGFCVVWTCVGLVRLSQLLCTYICIRILSFGQCFFLRVIYPPPLHGDMNRGPLQLHGPTPGGILLSPQGWQGTHNLPSFGNR